jgi:formate dehydrogenase subunit gamma
MKSGPESTTKILRFLRAERLLHWSIATPFLVCFSTALVLVLLCDRGPLHAHRDLVSWIHRISGVCMIILPIMALVSHWFDFRIYVRNIKEGCLWTIDDIRWLALMPLALVSSRVSLPEEGKFNAGEKLNFMMTMVSYPVFGVTGLLIWTAEEPFLPWLIHFFLALAVTPLIAGHIFMATINPASRKGFMGMITGFVDRQWAEHHYRRWFREEFEEPTEGSAPSSEAGSVADEPPRWKAWAARPLAWLETAVGLSPALVFLLTLYLGAAGFVGSVVRSKPEPMSPASPSAEPDVFRHFRGEVRLDPARVGDNAEMVEDAIISKLLALEGAAVEVTLEVRAEVKGGIDKQTISELTQDARKLRFLSSEFRPD